jgi:hypothetical protein
MRVSLVMTCRKMGGLQQSLVPYALALKSRGHTVQIVARRGADILDEVRRRGLEDDTCLLGGGWRLLWRLQTRELRRKLLEFAPDIVVGFAQKGFFEAARAMRGLDVPVVTRVGTMQPKRQGRFVKADGWLATTDEMQRSLTGLGFPAERVFVVPNFLADPVAPETGADRADQAGVPLIGTMARFVRRKGLHVLIEAVALLKHRGVRIRCDIAGGGRCARRAGAADRGARCRATVVRLVGWLAGDRKRRPFCPISLCSSVPPWTSLSASSIWKRCASAKRSSPPRRSEQCTYSPAGTTRPLSPWETLLRWRTPSRRWSNSSRDGRRWAPGRRKFTANGSAWAQARAPWGER